MEETLTTNVIASLLIRSGRDEGVTLVTFYYYNSDLALRIVLERPANAFVLVGRPISANARRVRAVQERKRSEDMMGHDAGNQMPEVLPNCSKTNFTDDCFIWVPCH